MADKLPDVGERVFLLHHGKRWHIKVGWRPGMLKEAGLIDYVSIETVQLDEVVTESLKVREDAHQIMCFSTCVHFVMLCSRPQ
jgi:hypothetical protein